MTNHIYNVTIFDEESSEDIKISSMVDVQCVILGTPPIPSLVKSELDKVIITKGQWESIKRGVDLLFKEMEGYPEPGT